MDNPQNINPKEKDTPKKENPIEEGKQAIEVQKKTSGKPEQEAEEENKKDAEKWRNEG